MFIAAMNLKPRNKYVTIRRTVCYERKLHPMLTGICRQLECPLPSGDHHLQVSGGALMIFLTGNVNYMSGENEEMDTTEVFLRLLLIGELHIPSGLQEKTGHFQDMLRKFGITLSKTEFSILDKTRIGNSVITVVYYSLDYQYAHDPSRKMVSIEGSVTTQLDDLGRLQISIDSTSTQPRPMFRAEHFRASPVEQ